MDWDISAFHGTSEKKTPPAILYHFFWDFWDP
jgi:hypothetical protein